MLLLTANESKHLSVGMALDKKPADPRNSFIIRPPRLFFFFLSARFISHCGDGRAAIIANFRFGDAACQLPRLVLPFRRDVYLAGSLWDLSRMRIPLSDRFIELYRSPALIGARDIDHVASKRCLGG